MLGLKIYINPIYFNYIIINFISPFLDKNDSKIKKNNFFFERKIQIEFSHIQLVMDDTHSSLNLEEEITSAWKRFFKKNKKVFQVENHDINSSIFSGYPKGHIKFIPEVNSIFKYIHSTTNITKASIKILDITLKTNDFQFINYMLRALMVFIYCLGSYSKKKIQKNIDLILRTIHFSEENEQLLNDKVSSIIIENEILLKDLSIEIYEELFSFNSASSYPSYLSDWKYSLGILKNTLSHNQKEKTAAFNLFKNQINLGDAQVYVMLKIFKESIYFDED